MNSADAILIPQQPHNLNNDCQIFNQTASPIMYLIEKVESSVGFEFQGF